MAEELGGAVVVENLMMTPEGCVVYVGTEDEGVQEEGSVDGAYVERIGHSDSLRVKLTGTELVETVRGFGGRLRSCSVNGSGECRVGIHLPSSQDPRDVIGAISRKVPGHEPSVYGGDSGEMSRRESGVLGKLTNRQREVLRTAHSEGFFKTPKGATGEELGEVLGVSGPTVHHHIRSAEEEILGSILDEGV